MSSIERAFFATSSHKANVAFTPGRAVSAGQMVSQARSVARDVSGASQLICLCVSRYRVALALLAGLELGVPCVMPHDHSPRTLTDLERRFPGAPILADSYVGDAQRGIFRVDEIPVPVVGARSLPSYPVEHPAAIVFTSGSTGSPTVHRKTWGALATSGEGLGRRFGLPTHTSVVATVPGQHMYGIEASIMMPLMAGGSFHGSQPLYPADVAEQLAAVPRPRVLVSTPFHLRALVRAGVALPQVDGAVSATAPMDPDLAASAERSLRAPLTEVLGCTEAGAVATRRPVTEREWRPCPGVALRIHAGQTFVDRPYQPAGAELADEIVPRGNGRFILARRSADMIKIAGKRASLSDITAKLLAIEGVDDAALFLPAAGVAGTVERVVAFVVAPGLSANAIRERLRHSVDPAFLPRPIVQLDRLPRNATGKVTRSALSALLAGDGKAVMSASEERA